MKKKPVKPVKPKPKTPDQMLKEFLRGLSGGERNVYKKSREYLQYRKDKATTTPPYLPAKMKKRRQDKQMGKNNIG